MTEGFISIICMSVMVTVAQILLKKGSSDVIISGSLFQIITSFLQFKIVFGFMCVMIAPLFYINALRTLPLNTAYMLTSINIVLITLVGRFVFNERVSFKRLVGITIILIGILLYAL